jgi:hypothetical protein
MLDRPRSTNCSTCSGEKHAGAIDKLLLSRMLHLDPGKRITAVEGPSHFYMQDYIENSNSDAFRCRFVQDWISLKRKLN